MKKYQQLLLVILSVLSFVSLLFYRHEYNKLRYVLEVFNFFGTPGVPSVSSCPQNDSAVKYLLSEPLPAWQRISNTLYVYSAYWETLPTKGQAKALAIGILNENFSYGCYLWYERYSEPVKGQFRFLELSRKNGDFVAKGRLLTKFQNKKNLKINGFMFYCDIESEKEAPIGVTFYKKSEDEMAKAFLPIYKMKMDLPEQNSTVVCILPNEYTYLKKHDYLEFLSFHTVIGIKYFIIYGGSYLYKIISTVLRNNAYDMSLMVMQWNYPFNEDFDLMYSIAENDCLLRTSGLFENVMIMKWNQFFVPRSHNSVQNIIMNLDREKRISTFQVNSLVFCLEYEDDHETKIYQPLIIKKTQYSLLKIDNPVFIYRTSVKNGTVKKINKDLVSIHWYVKCNLTNLRLKEKYKTKIDHSVSQFQADVMQSKIMAIGK